ncbi:MAG: phytanoyl-CoA dioxygenase family protein [Gammaproteobacteria bacterium]|nr:phytanoyl-CoA dioxygenase family protein [Gammaproteobacteria bacterium]
MGSSHLQLTPIQQRDYVQTGFLAPLRLFSNSEAQQLRSRLESFESRFGTNASAKRTDLHLLQQWAWQVVTDPRIIGPLTDLLGPDLLLWSTQWFIKEPGDGMQVSLHQDANYWGLEPHDIATVWIALSDAGLKTGPMRFIPGSHQGKLHSHDNTYEKDNLLSRGQTIREELDLKSAQTIPLKAGEMSIHHVRLIHGSGPNQTSDRRIGMVLRYCASHVQQTKGPDTAVLVAGEDRFNHFQLLSAPDIDFGPAETRRHQDAVEKLQRIIHMD